MKLKVMRMDESINLPCFARKGDACFDIQIVIDEYDFKPMRFTRGEFVPFEPRWTTPESKRYFVIGPCESVVFHTGLKFEIEEGHMMEIHVRSSTGIKNNLILSNGTGIIDAGYRGEVRVALTNVGHEPVMVSNGDRVAQARIVKLTDTDIIEVDSLGASERGEGGIGSTGK